MIRHRYIILQVKKSTGRERFHLLESKLLESQKRHSGRVRRNRAAPGRISPGAAAFCPGPAANANAATAKAMPARANRLVPKASASATSEDSNATNADSNGAFEYSKAATESSNAINEYADVATESSDARSNLRMRHLNIRMPQTNFRMRQMNIQMWHLNLRIRQTNLRMPPRRGRRCSPARPQPCGQSQFGVGRIWTAPAERARRRRISGGRLAAQNDRSKQRKRRSGEMDLKNLVNFVCFCAENGRNLAFKSPPKPHRGRRRSRQADVSRWVFPVRR